MIKLSILIPVFNGLEYTKECLLNLNQQIEAAKHVIEAKIIVVDDGSKDGTGSWIQKHYPGITLLAGDGNLWWSGSINVGMKYAFEQGDDYVLWWNNDIIADNSYLFELANVLKLNLNEVYGSKIYHFGNKQMVWAMGGYFNANSGKKGMYAFNVPDVESLQKDIEVQWLPGMGTIVPKMVYDKIGLLDNINFPQYHGDSDYTYRAYLAGFKIRVLFRLIIYNNVENSGLPHGYSFKVFMQSFNSLKSKYNLNKNLTFYRKYANSIRAYGFLAYEYFRYIGGFFKWNTLNKLGINKNKG